MQKQWWNCAGGLQESQKMSELAVRLWNYFSWFIILLLISGDWLVWCDSSWCATGRGFFGSADGQHPHGELLMVFGVMRVALAMSWCRLEAWTVCVSFLQSTVGRGPLSWEGRTHLNPYSALIPALFQFNDAKMPAVCVGTLTSPHSNLLLFPYTILPDFPLMQIFSSYIRDFL